MRTTYAYSTQLLQLIVTQLLQYSKSDSWRCDQETSFTLGGLTHLRRGVSKWHILPDILDTSPKVL